MRRRARASFAARGVRIQLAGSPRFLVCSSGKISSCVPYFVCTVFAPFCHVLVCVAQGSRIRCVENKACPPALVCVARSSVLFLLLLVPFGALVFPGSCPAWLVCLACLVWP